jgi:methylphosphonate synthase
MTNGSYSTKYLAAASGVEEGRLESAINGNRTLDFHELEAVAQAMCVPVRELIVSMPDTESGVKIVRRAGSPEWFLEAGERPRYRMRELAGSRITPHSKSLELEILPGSGKGNRLSTGLHQYAYNLGPLPVAFDWIYDGIEHGTVIEPEESLYVKPHITHWFENVQRSDVPSRVLLLRVGGKVVGDAALEASIIGRESLSRVVAETMCWYNPEG